MEFESERFIYREHTEVDAGNFYALNSDPLVIQYTGDKAFQDERAAAEFLRTYTHYREYGFGRWATIEKASGQYVGWCGLKYSPSLKEHDLGYRFFRKYWGQGFATEAAARCLDVGFDKFQLQEIVGRCRKENQASIRVLQKIGMEFKGVRYHSDHEELIFHSTCPPPVPDL
jgi:[ribosomal protein S5]-alanine N-acetyltransferase